ncbi:MAG: transcription termination factor Rho [Actinomycetota bacterium]|nr:MAG: transcription termination factor Rho [Actinomycetota bacterium]
MAAEALEQSVLESKDKEQLLAIASALGVKATSRSKKSDIIDKILETVGAGASAAPAAEGNGATSRPADRSPRGAASPETGEAGDDERRADDSAAADAAAPPSAEVDAVVLGPDGEPLAEWEIELAKQGVDTAEPASSGGAARSERSGGDAEGSPRPPRDDRQAGQGRQGAERQGGQGGQGQQGAERQGGQGQQGGQGGAHGDDGDGNRRKRRRRRGKSGRDEIGPQGTDRDIVEEGVEQPSMEPVAVSGYLDLRDEGYGFLRVKGYLPSKDDVYISVRQTRQYGLRKGDHITGMSRPAARNEKNPALLELLTVNGGDPDKIKNRPRFEDLTALFPDERLHLEDGSDPMNMTARIIDLVSPIGKGQRGIIVSPPKAGKTTVMKTIATAIERNNPEVTLMVLLIDERPEEVTDMRRTVKGEVISSTFDRPSDEHTHVAELAIEKAKRLVEQGEDVVVILDGITRLSRAYNLAAPASGRILSGGIDAGALYPPKKFFGAARNVEEGGSLTILATALVETNSRMDEAIFEEFKGTGNMELRLDRKLSERRIYPAIDVDASSTRHEELLFDRKQLQMVWKLRRVLSGLAADGNAAPGLELLIDRLRTFRTNDEFLNEIAKQPSM